MTFLCAHSPAFSTRAAAKSLQSGPTLCDPMDCSLPGSSVHGVSRQKYWSGLPCPPPGDLPDPGIEPVPLKSPVLVGRFFTNDPPGKLLPYTAAAAAAAKSLQSCLTLYDPIDGSPPGSPVPEILQARVLEWGALPSPVRLFS